MGSSASKARKLPRVASHSQVLHPSSVPNNGPSPLSRQQLNHPQVLNQGNNTDNNPLREERKETNVNPLDALSEQGSAPEVQKSKEVYQENKNSKSIRPVKVLEVPLKLDQNHPSLKILQNKTKLEQESKLQQKLFLKNLEQLHKNGNTGEKIEPLIKTKLTPDEFSSLVQDINRFDLDKLQKVHNVDKQLIESIQRVGLEVATSVYKRTTPKKEPKKAEDLKKKEGNKFEETLEELLK